MTETEGGRRLKRGDTFDPEDSRMTTIQEAEVRVRNELGFDYQVVKIGGRWVIGSAADGRFKRVSPEPLRRSLDLAIADVPRL